MQFIRDWPGIWRSLNGWLKAGLIWVIVTNIASLVLIEVHSRSAGPYNAPDKVAVRKAVAAARIAGMLLVVVPGLVVTSRRAEKSSGTKAGQPPAT